MQKLIDCQQRNLFSQKTTIPQLFQQAKHLMHHITEQLNHCSYSKLVKIQTIALNRIKCNQIVNTTSFVGIFSLFSFVTVFLFKSMVGYSMRLTSNFYRNIATNFKKLTEEFINNNQSHDLMQITTTLLYGISHLLSQKQMKFLDRNKLFSASTIRSLLKLKFKNNQRSMKSYIVLILSLIDARCNKVRQQQFIGSLVQHLIDSNSIQNTEISIIFLINRILKNSMLQIPKCALLVSKIKCVIIKQQTTTQIIKLCLNLLDKISKMDGNLLDNLFTVQQIFQFSNKLSKVDYSDYYPLNHFFTMIFIRLDHNQRIQITNRLIDKELTNSNLQIIEHLTRKIDFDVLVIFMQSGLFQRLIQILQYQYCLDQTKLILNKIFINILKLQQQHSNCQSNSYGLFQAIKRLYQWRFIKIYNQQFPQ